MTAAPKIDSPEALRAKRIDEDHALTGPRKAGMAMMLGICCYCDADLKAGQSHAADCPTTPEQRAALDSHAVVLRLDEAEAKARWEREAEERRRWAACRRHAFGSKRAPSDTCIRRCADGTPCGAPRGHR